jgi:hypothetical protein
MTGNVAPALSTTRILLLNASSNGARDCSSPSPYTRNPISIRSYDLLVNRSAWKTSNRYPPIRLMAACVKTLQPAADNSTTGTATQPADRLRQLFTVQPGARHVPPRAPVCRRSSRLPVVRLRFCGRIQFLLGDVSITRRSAASSASTASFNLWERISNTLVLSTTVLVLTVDTKTG